jgi:hypothetical protein
MTPAPRGLWMVEVRTPERGLVVGLHVSCAA